MPAEGIKGNGDEVTGVEQPTATTPTAGSVQGREAEDTYLTAYLNNVRTGITKRAESLARQNSRDPEMQDYARASLDIAPGTVFPIAEPSWWHRILSSITGITIVSGILTVTFGVLGLVLLRNPGLVDASQAQGFLDIAKIFAGAVVGSAGETAITQRSQT